MRRQVGGRGGRQAVRWIVVWRRGRLRQRVMPLGVVRRRETSRMIQRTAVVMGSEGTQTRALLQRSVWISGFHVKGSMTAQAMRLLGQTNTSLRQVAQRSPVVRPR